MKRVVVALAGVVLLAGGGTARGQWEPFDPALKKFMPKDQLEFVEKAQALADLHHTLLSRIPDAKKRGEENEMLAARMRELHASLVQKLNTEGLKDWVCKTDVLLPKFMFACGTMNPFHLNFKLPKDGKARNPEEATLVTFKPDDVFRFSIKPDKSYAMPKAVVKTWGPFQQEIKPETVTKVEKVGVWAFKEKKVLTVEKK